jgi:SOS-response transcriptional repressor LexA
MSALTAKQRELLDYLRLYTETWQESPSFEEMKVALGLRSKSGVHRLISALVERGYIRRIPNRARCIQIVPDPHLPDNLHSIPLEMIASEARRRGLLIGRIGRDEHGAKRFFEIAA